MTLYFLQQYWWVLVSLLGALLVFLMFVQGGQTLLYGVAENDDEKRYLLKLYGHKWELTFTTLVTFGGAAFASFPLFYSTSFGGAYWLWLLILFLFVLQAVSYEFRSHDNNLLGTKTYDFFLFINGLLGTLFIGVAVATLFTGGAYVMDKSNISAFSNPIVSVWTNGWMGLDSFASLFNILLGLVVLFAARTLGILYAIANLSTQMAQQMSHFAGRLKKRLIISGTLFVVLFVTFLVALALMNGYAVDSLSGTITEVKYKYFLNFTELCWPVLMLAVGVICVLAGLLSAVMGFFGSRNEFSFWITGLGVVLAVWSILISAALNNTAFFPSTVDPQCSLTLYNSSSSLFTLKTMFYVSLLIPFVIWYIAAMWRKLR